MSAVEQMAKVLSVTEADLAFAPLELLDRLMAEHNISTEGRIQVHIHVGKHQPQGEGTKSATQELARHFAEQEKRAQEPWRAGAALLETRRNRYKAESREALQRAFVDLAKNQMLSVTESIIGTYSLFGSEFDQRFFAALICRENPDERIRSHNFFVAEQMGPDFMAQYGAQLMELEFPLFAPDDRLSTLNQRLLRESREVTGSGAPRTPSVFRRSAHEAELVGGGSLPVQQGQNGLEVDVTLIEEAFGNLFNTVQQLQNAFAEIQANIPKDKLDKLAISKQFAAIRRQLSNARSATRSGRRTDGRQPPSYQRYQRDNIRGGDAPPADEQTRSSTGF